MERKRLVYIDVARGLGIVLVVFGHVLTNGFIRQYLYSFHFPLFFFLSGLTYRYPKDKKYFWKNKIARIYIPYITWALISILIFCVFWQLDIGKTDIERMEGSFVKNIWGMIYANSRNGYMKWNIPLWFLPCLLAVYLIADGFETAFGKTGRIKALRMLSILISLLFVWVVSRFLRKMKLPFAFETAVFMYSFFEMGILLRNSRLMNKLMKFLHEQKTFAACLGVLLLIAIIPLCFLNGMAQVRIMVLGKSFALFLLCSAGGILGIALLSIRLQSAKAAGTLVLIGRNTMPVLLMHKFPILLYQSVVPESAAILKDGNAVLGIAVSVAVSAITIGLCLLVGRLIEKTCPFMLGKSQADQQALQ